MDARARPTSSASVSPCTSRAAAYWSPRRERNRSGSSAPSAIRAPDVHQRAQRHVGELPVDPEVDVGRQAHLERDPGVHHGRQQRRILGGPDAVTDPGRLQVLDHLGQPDAPDRATPRRAGRPAGRRNGRSGRRGSIRRCRPPTRCCSARTRRPRPRPGRRVVPPAAPGCARRTDAGSARPPPRCRPARRCRRTPRPPRRRRSPGPGPARPRMRRTTPIHLQLQAPGPFGGVLGGGAAHDGAKGSSPWTTERARSYSRWKRNHPRLSAGTSSAMVSISESGSSTPRASARRCSVGTLSEPVKCRCSAFGNDSRRRHPYSCAITMRGSHGSPGGLRKRGGLAVSRRRAEVSLGGGRLVLKGVPRAGTGTPVCAYRVARPEAWVTSF